MACDVDPGLAALVGGNGVLIGLYPRLKRLMKASSLELLAADRGENWNH